MSELKILEGLKVHGDLKATGAVYDSNDSPGTSGQLLQSTATGTDWVDAISISAGDAEAVHLAVKNTSGATITKGTPVYITGNVGSSDRLEVAPADASDASKMPAVGLLESDLANNAEGYVAQGGYLKGLSTATIDGTSTSSNDTVYVKAGGGLTMTKPTGTNYIQNVAKVARVHASSGSLVVSSILRTNDVPTPLYIDHANQRLGIGTDSPADALHIKSTTTDARALLDGATGFDAELKFAENQVVKYTIGHDAATDNFVIGTTNVDTNQRLVIDSSGNVGIGTITPQDVLHVQGRIRTNTSGVAFNDTNAVIYRSSNDLELRTYGGFDINLIPSNNVGIGTTSPTNKLHVVGGAVHINSGADKQLRFSGTNKNTYSFEHDASRIYLYDETSSAARFTIMDDGNIGINNNAPQYELDLATNNEESPTDIIRLGSRNGPSSNDGTSLGTGLIFKPYYGSYTKRSAGIMQVAEGNYFKSGLAFFTNGTSDTTTDWSERMRIDMNGNVGIGTTQPLQRFHVEGTAYFGGGSNLAFQSGGDVQTNTAIVIDKGDRIKVRSGQYLRDLLHQDSTNSIIKIGSTGTSLIAGINLEAGHDGNANSAQVRVYGGSTEYVRFDGYNKRVGIGTTSPGTKLHVSDGEIRISNSYGNKDIAQYYNTLTFKGDSNCQFYFGTSQNPSYSTPLPVHTGKLNVTGHIYGGSAVQTITTTSGTINLDAEDYGVFRLTSSLTGTTTLNIQNMKSGQVIDVVLTGDQTVNLTSDDTAETFYRIGETTYDGTATNHLQIVCISDANSAAIYHFTVAKIASSSSI